LRFLLYCAVPTTSSIGSIAAFVVCFLVIISMYGGGFATVPAYLKDMFGARYVGAIHGLLLTAWSMAGIFGPVLVNYIREYNITHGLPKAQAYNVTMYIMAGLLVIGFIANLLVKAVDKRHHMAPDGETALVPNAEHLADLPRKGSEKLSVGDDIEKQSLPDQIRV
jgi:MFS family permease